MDAEIEGRVAKEYWGEEVVEAYKEFLLSCGKKYPDLSKDQRRNFRKRASDFVVQDGKLYYTKTTGFVRLALGSEEDQQRVFQVRALAL